jgi:hypothetical protein
MLAFNYLAYQMMSLPLETKLGLTDSWIECLGDLARHRMAIEEDREIYTVWGGVAGHWYVKAADRYLQIERLYHHSGILERPSLRKSYPYGRALTSFFPARPLNMIQMVSIYLQLQLTTPSALLVASYHGFIIPATDLGTRDYRVLRTQSSTTLFQIEWWSTHSPRTNSTTMHVQRTSQDKLYLQ